MPADANDETVIADSPYFIEPSTSELLDVSNYNYIGIEAIWNDKNYWVNLQALDGGCAVCLYYSDDYIDYRFLSVSFFKHILIYCTLQNGFNLLQQYNFTLMNTEFWEHFLPDEPQSLLGVTLHPRQNDNVIPRHLVMPNSWVGDLDVPRNSNNRTNDHFNYKQENETWFVFIKPYPSRMLFLEYLMLYPTGKKVVSYMNALKEYYGDYIMPDGLIEKTTFYAEPDYASKTLVKEIYKHRADKMISVETNYNTDKEVETVEYFTIGRKDCLKSVIFVASRL